MSFSMFRRKSKQKEVDTPTVIPEEEEENHEVACSPDQDKSHLSNYLESYPSSKQNEEIPSKEDYATSTNENVKENWLDSLHISPSSAGSHDDSGNPLMNENNYDNYDDDDTIASVTSLSSIQRLEEHVDNANSSAMNDTRRTTQVLSFASTLVDAMTEMRSKMSFTNNNHQQSSEQRLNGDDDEQKEQQKLTQQLQQEQFAQAEEDMRQSMENLQKRRPSWSSSSSASILSYDMSSSPSSQSSIPSMPSPYKTTGLDDVLNIDSAEEDPRRCQQLQQQQQQVGQNTEEEYQQSDNISYGSDSYNLDIGDGLESFSMTSFSKQSKDSSSIPSPLGTPSKSSKRGEKGDGKAVGTDTSSASSPFVPHEIALLHLEADLLLESIRNGVPPKAMDEFYSNARDIENGLSPNNNNNTKQAGKKQSKSSPKFKTHTTTANANASANSNINNQQQGEVEDDVYSFASSLVTAEGDDDGMRREIQTLGRAVTNLRRDLNGLTIQYGSAASIGGESSTTYSSGMFQDAVSAAAGSSHSRDNQFSRFGRRRGGGAGGRLRDMWSSAFEEIKMTFKTLRNLQRHADASYTLPTTHQDASKQSEGGTTSSRSLTTIVHFAPALLWALSILLLGSYVRASMHTMGDGFDPKEGLDLLLNLGWIFGKDE